MTVFNAADLQNKQDCDLVLGFIAEEKDDLDFEQIVRGREAKDDTDAASRLEIDLIQANADLAKEEEKLVGLAAGPAKEIQITKKMRADVRVRSLNERKATTGIIAVFKSDYQSNTVTGKLTWLNQKESEVIAQKGILPA